MYLSTARAVTSLVSLNRDRRPRMPSRQSVLNAVAAIVIVFSYGYAATAAEILEITPGLTKLIKPDRTVQSVLTGNPNVADASIINLNSIAITGKAVGVTNVILFDAQGKVISNTRVQVVSGDNFREGRVVSEGNEVQVLSLGGPTRTYLCGSGCSEMTVTKTPSNPPASKPPPSTTAPAPPVVRGLGVLLNSLGQSTAGPAPQ